MSFFFFFFSPAPELSDFLKIIFCTLYRAKAVTLFYATIGIDFDATHVINRASRRAVESHQISDGGDCVWGPSHRQLGPAMLAEYPGKVLHSFGLTRELWLHCRLCKRGLLDNLSLLDNVYIGSSR